MQASSSSSSSSSSAPPEVQISTDFSRFPKGWLERLAEKFAPEVRLHSEELYHPATVEWYLDRVSLRFNTGKGDSDPIIIEKVGSTEEDIIRLVSQSFEFDGYRFSSGIEKNRRISDGTPIGNGSRFYMRRLDDSFPDTQYGQKEETANGQVPVYVNALLYGDELDLQYFFFYAHNGPLLPRLIPTAGVHEGDWEHITVRISASTEAILAIFMDSHGNEGRWYTDVASSNAASANDGYKLTNGTHPIVYSSKCSHAVKPNAGRHKRAKFGNFQLVTPIDDETDDAGVRWQTWKKIVLLRPREEATIEDCPSLLWLRFNGDWGKVRMKKNAGGTFLEGNGPYGPAMKRFYTIREPRMTHENCIPSPAGSEHSGLEPEEVWNFKAINERCSNVWFCNEDGVGGLSVQLGTIFVKLWDDRGTGSIQDGSFWRPVPPPGYFFLGDVCLNNKRSNSWNCSCVVVREEEGNKEPLLTKPISYKKVWDSRGTGTKCSINKKKGISIWEPLPLPGYTAVGHIISQSKDDKAPPADAVDRFRCVHNSLLVPGTYRMKGKRAGWLWCDKDSGGSFGRVSVWAVGAYSDKATAALPAGTFITHNDYGVPDPALAFCFGVSSSGKLASSSTKEE